MVSEKTNRVLVSIIQLGHSIKLFPIVWDPVKYGVTLDYGRPRLIAWIHGNIFIVHLVDIFRLLYLSLNVFLLTYLLVFVLFLEHTTTDVCIAFVWIVGLSICITVQTIFIFTLGEFCTAINLFYNLDNDLRNILNG
jgi:hypothetical protein